MSKELLNLSNLYKKKLKTKFKAAYATIMAGLYPGETGTINIAVKLKRVENTTTMVNVEYAMNSKLPAKKRACIGEIVDGNLLKVEPAKLENVAQLRLIKEGGEKVG